MNILKKQEKTIINILRNIKLIFRLQKFSNKIIFTLLFEIFRELSSAGSEHLPYKQGVRGSNPLVPTSFKPRNFGAFFIYLIS